MIDLRNGVVGALVGNEKTLVRYCLSQEPDQFRTLPEALNTEEIAVEMRKDKIHLLENLNGTLEEMKEDEEEERLSEKWFWENLIMQ